MTCKDDEDEQCFEDCHWCCRYKSETPCPECDTLTDRKDLERYEGKCWDCFFETMLDDPFRLKQFAKDNEDLYAEYIKVLYG